MTRLVFHEVHPPTLKALLALDGSVRKSSLGAQLVDLIYLRVSQMNGCAYCIDMHTKDLVALGEKPERLALLMVWREATTFTPRERAALAYAESLTRPAGHETAPDAVYAPALTEFGEVGIVELTLAISMINVWNRFGLAFHMVPGHYVAQAK